MEASYVPNRPSVSSELIDGEAIIMHLRLGHYFSTEGSGALIWSGIEQDAPMTLLAEALSRQYGLADDDAVAAVATFVASLQEHDLLRPGQSAGRVPDPAEHGINVTFAEPELAVYTDMQDLLLLDPIHDVDSTGWPVAPAAADR